MCLRGDGQAERYIPRSFCLCVRGGGEGWEGAAQKRTSSKTKQTNEKTLQQEHRLGAVTSLAVGVLLNQVLLEPNPGSNPEIALFDLRTYFYIISEQKKHMH